ncbi:DUF1127 domain-containing protein [Bradyrhizobium sp. LHD-71]|uniref:DUF1127 domain-containing protein n=1 Tax=Bradyrhizobium sp. LHD-71 TaxID=3072141 RepID=UPI0035BE8273
MDPKRRATSIIGPSASSDFRTPRNVVSRSSPGTGAAPGGHDVVRVQRSSWGTRFLSWCVWCSDRFRQRKALSKLDDRLLNDIGKTRQQADAEAAKPFWK